MGHVATARAPAPTVVLYRSADGGLVGRRIRLVERVAERSASHGLDRRLAAGASPEDGPMLALHALRITTPGHRASLARCLDHVVAVAAGAAVAPRGTVAPWWPAVRRASAALGALARRLEDPRPVSPRVTAECRLLLGDGAGPLFCATAPDLAGMVARLLDRLAAEEATLS